MRFDQITTKGVAITVLVMAGSFPLQGLAQTSRPTIMRAGALDDLPRHLAEIWWSSDLASLFVIRFMPEKASFDAGWSGWVTEQMLQLKGYMTRPDVESWPSFFSTDRGAMSSVSGQLSPMDMQAFQAWCLRRSQLIPRVIVHAVPYVAPIGDDARASGARLLPLGLATGQPKESQRVTAYGFGQSVILGLAGNADDSAVTVPPDVLASLPAVGVKLETRLRWSDPVRSDGALLVPGEPVSIRLVADRRVLWEHAYTSAAAPPAPPAPKARPEPRPQSDITF